MFLYLLRFLLPFIIVFIYGDLFILCDNEMVTTEYPKKDLTSTEIGIAMFTFIVILYIGSYNLDLAYSQDILARGLYGIIDPGLLSPSDFDKPTFFTAPTVSSESIPTTETTCLSINGNTPITNIKKDTFF